MQKSNKLIDNKNIYVLKQIQDVCIIRVVDMKSWLTWTETASLAANASMSAQDTVLGHFASTALFMASMTSNPAKDRFGIASLSAVLLAVELNKTDPSQPWNVRLQWNHVMLYIHS